MLTETSVPAPRHLHKEPPPKSGQRSLRIVMIGAGAVGSEAALQLDGSGTAFDGLAYNVAESPVASVLVVDPDLLEARNVALSRTFRSVAAREGAVCFGQYKADLLVRALQPGSAIRWSAAPMEIADLGWQDLKGCDLLLSCTDNVLARLETALVSNRLGIPMLDAAVMGTGLMAGRLSWFPGAGEAACYLCGIGESRRGDLLAYAAASSLGCRPPEAVAAMGEQPDVPASVRETAALAIETVRRFALQCSKQRYTNSAETEASWAVRLTGAGPTWERDLIRLPRSPTCPLHGVGANLVVPVCDDRPIREVLLAAKLKLPEKLKSTDWRLQFTWPLCVAARCRGCGSLHETPQRLAALRKGGRCLVCGVVGQLDPLRCIAEVGLDDPESNLTPRQLGLPQRHMFELREILHPVAGRRETQ